MNRHILQSRLHNRLRRLRSGSEPPFGNPDEDRMCWICLTGDEDQRRRDWVHPCRCRGTNKWVHESCLCRWVDEKEMLFPDVPVTCTQCRTEYIIVMPQLCRFDNMLERLDKTCARMGPSVLMGILAATVYFSAVTYGALTMIELAGYTMGLKLLQEDPSLLMILLPSVPTLLLLGRLVPWEEYVIICLRRHNRRGIPAEHLDAMGLPLPGAPLGDDYFDELEREYPEAEAEQLGRASASFCIALSLPTIGVVLGQKLFGGIYGDSKVLSIVLGGLTFVAVKGLATIYLRQSQYQRRRNRFVMDYTPPNRINHLAQRR